MPVGNSAPAGIVPGSPAQKSSLLTTARRPLSFYMGRAKRIWYLSPMRAAKVQASLRIRAVSPEPSLLAHTSSESRGTFRQKARSLAPLNGWACAVKICNDGMLEDTNSLDGAHMVLNWLGPVQTGGSDWNRFSSCAAPATYLSDTLEWFISRENFNFCLPPGGGKRLDWNSDTF